MIVVRLPRFVIAKKLKSGATAFYFNVPTRYRKAGCPIRNEPLGTDYSNACGPTGYGGKAQTLNAFFDEWFATSRGLTIAEGVPNFGTVDWLFAEYKSSKAYLEKVSERSRKDYERTMLLVADLVSRKGKRIGSYKIASISPKGADKI